MSKVNTSTPWFRRNRSRQLPRARLIAFHHAGGSASYYRSWPAELPADIEIVAVQLPGREERFNEPPPSSIEQAAGVLARQLAPLLDVPCAFFGHSMGALLAFEVTRELRRTARATPRHLFVSARWAPQLPDPLPPISVLPQDELLGTLDRMGGTPPELLANRELMEIVMPILRADFGLCERHRHRPEPPLDLPITAFGGLDDAAPTPAAVEPWSVQTTAAFRVHFFPGDHFFLGAARPMVLAEIAAAFESGSHHRAAV